MKTLSAPFLLLLAVAGLCSCHHVKEDDYTRAAKTLDVVDQYRQQWGSMTISSVVPVPAVDLFAFDPGLKDSEYLTDAQKEVNVSAAQSLANTVITSLSARASMAQPLNLSKAPTSSQPALPTAPDANITATPLPLKDLGATTIPMRLALLQAYNDKVFAKILDLTGHPTLPKGHKLLALVCVASCVPGTQTSTGYRGVLLGSVDYAKHPAGTLVISGNTVTVEDTSQWYYGVQDARHYVPGILAVLPLSDSQFIRENNLNKDASTLALSLAALFEAQGISIGADALFKASKELDTSRDSTVAEAATMAMPTSRGFSLIFNPTFQAVADLAAKKSSSDYKLQAQTFPIVILVDLNPAEAQGYNYLSVSVEPRWESMSAGQPSTTIKKTVEIADKLDAAYANVSKLVGAANATVDQKLLDEVQHKFDEAVAKMSLPTPAPAAPPVAGNRTVPAAKAAPAPSPAAGSGQPTKIALSNVKFDKMVIEAVNGMPNVTPTEVAVTVTPVGAPATPADSVNPVSLPTTQTFAIVSVWQAAGPSNYFKNLVLRGSLDSLFDRAMGYQQFVDISSFTAEKKDKPTVGLVPADAPIAYGAEKKFYLLASDSINTLQVTLCGPDGNVSLTSAPVAGNPLLYAVTLPKDSIAAFETGNHEAILSLKYDKEDPQLIPVTMAGKKEEPDSTIKTFTLKWDDKGKLITVTVPEKETVDTDANVIKSLAPAFTAAAPAAPAGTAKGAGTATADDPAAPAPAPAKGTGTGTKP